jgi:hypothetical protein
MAYSTSSTADTWYYWNDTGTSSTTSTVWIQWVGAVASSSTVSSYDTSTGNDVWTCWVVTDSNGTIRQATPSRVAETPEEIAAREERQRVAAEQRVAASARARQVLLENLTAKQKKEFEKHGWFIVQGQKSNKRYKIMGNVWSGNVHELRAANDNTRVASYCCHTPQSMCPLEDNLLAQKLMLETAEEEFLRLANRSAA